MIAPATEKRIAKYLVNEATAKDLDVLSDWILVEGNTRIFEDYVRSHYETTMALHEPDTDKIKEILKRRMRRDRKIYRLQKVRSLMKYAAVGLLFLALGYFFHRNQVGDVGPGKLVPKHEVVTITLHDGTVETLDPNSKKKITNPHGNVVGNQNGSKLTYHNAIDAEGGNTNAEELVYNTLKVPYGKRFDVILSDGTHIFLNSGTTLRYPVKFLRGLDRNVYLTGEAYFDVTEDKDHPFIVHADALDIQVLGTRFNVSHYPEETTVNTVLVEGSVELSQDGEAESGRGTLLSPGFKAEWQKAGNDIAVENVDTDIYTAWLQGRLVFRNTPFRTIRRALERKYNVTIKNNNEDLDAQLFDATFDIETIEEVLESFATSYAINYNIHNNRVIIE